MPKRRSKKAAKSPRGRSKKAAKAPETAVSVDWLRKGLAKRTKAELVDVLMDLAEADRGIFRRLESQFELRVPPEELVAATRRAIADATDFDERDINYNFSYDYGAYDAVQRNFRRLIELGHLRTAMELSLMLMERGSYQVEMSDEGMMTEDVEACLQIVIDALEASELPARDVTTWCEQMREKDRVKFICDGELAALRERFETAER